ncbi:MAG: hypothetical protein HDS41_05555 [Bacteroides sp.]|nr:hypothetical protein [Bacteroides sp.]
MKYTIAGLIFCVMTVAFVSCHRRSAAGMEMDRAQQLIDCCPDSALALLTETGTQPMTEAERARHALLFTVAQDRNYITPESDSAIGIASSFYPVGSEERMKADYYAARINFRNGEYGRELDRLAAAEKSAAKRRDHYWLGMIYREFAYLFNELKWTDSECFYARKEYESFRSVGDSLLVKFAALDYGRALGRSSDDKMHNCGIALLDSLTASADSDDALDMMLRADAGSIKLGILFKHMMFSRLNITIDNYEYVRRACIESLPDSFFRTEKDNLILENPFTPGFVLAVVTQPYASEMHRRLNELNLDLYHREYAVLDSVFRYPDYYKHYDKVEEMGKSDQSRVWLEEQSRRELEKTVQETRRKRILTVSVVFAVVAVAGLIVWLHSRRMRKKFIEEASGLRALLRVKEGDVSGMQKCVDSLYSEKFDMLEQMCDMFILPSKHTSEQKRIYENVRSIVDSFKMNGNRHAEIEEHVNKYKDNVVAKFRSDFPGLPERDYSLFVYLAAGFSRQAIAFLMDDPVESISNRKSRLKKRIASFSGAYRDLYSNAIR